MQTLSLPSSSSSQASIMGSYVYEEIIDYEDENNIGIIPNSGPARGDTQGKKYLKKLFSDSSNGFQIFVWTAESLREIDFEYPPKDYMAKTYYARTHINNWPPEVLGNIFHNARIDGPDDPARATLCEFSRLFSQVCQYWRAVALNDSKLWNQFFSISGSSEWLSEVLRRSQGQNLYLDLNLDDCTNSENLLAVLTRYASRIAAFEVQVVEPDLPYHENMKYALRAPMPALKSVRWREYEDLTWTPPFQYREDFPALEKLEFLQKGMPDLSSPSLLGLRSLNIFETRVSTQQLFSILRPFQELEELGVMRSDSWMDIKSVGPYDKLRLPKLESLQINDYWGTAIEILQNLELPSLNRFRADWYIRGSETKAMASQIHGVLDPILIQWPQDDWASACLKFGTTTVAFYTLAKDADINDNDGAKDGGQECENEDTEGAWEDEDDYQEEEDKENHKGRRAAKFALDMEIDSSYPGVIEFSTMVLTAYVVRVTRLELKVSRADIDGCVVGITQCLMLCKSLEILVLSSLPVVVSVFPSLMKAGQRGYSVLPSLSTIRFSDIPDGAPDLFPGWEKILLKFLKWRKEYGQKITVNFGSLKVSTKLRAAWSNILGVDSHKLVVE